MHIQDKNKFNNLKKNQDSQKAGMYVRTNLPFVMSFLFKHFQNRTELHKPQ